MSLYDTLMEEVKGFSLGLFNKAEQERRIDICTACDKYLTDTHKCSVCKCSISHTVLFTRNSCPEGKWRGAELQEELVDVEQVDFTPQPTPEGEAE